MGRRHENSGRPSSRRETSFVLMTDVCQFDNERVVWKTVIHETSFAHARIYIESFIMFHVSLCVKTPL